VRLDDDQALVVDRAGVPRIERVLLGHARAVPPMWNVRIVNCVPGSPIDCALR
jgi:hypothetical protein